MEKFLEIIRKVCDRPTLYLGCVKMRHFRSFLTGYRIGSEEIGESQKHPFDGFPRWVEHRFGIYHAAWGWDRILVHVAGSDAEAIRTMPALFQEYLDAVEHGEFDPDAPSPTIFEPKQTCTEGYYE